MTVTVRTILDPGGEGVTGGETEEHEFATEAEAEAFKKGVNLANKQTHGWTDGWLQIESDSETH